MKKKLILKSILIVSLLITTVIIICFITLHTQPPKLKDIKTIRVEYSPKLIESLSLVSPLEIDDTEQIDKLVSCFNIRSEYGIGCDCPSEDMKIYFISNEGEYVYNIGITGDPRIQYEKVSDKDIFGIDIDDVIDILNQNQGSENLKYPYE